MKVYVKEELSEDECREMLTINIDGKTVFEVMDDEPEDSNLSRSFADCYNIPDLLQMAYMAGVRNEGFEIVYDDEALDEEKE